MFCPLKSKGLPKFWEHLFTFLEHEGVAPTYNSAERGIRPAVQWRKICFGNRSEKGELMLWTAVHINNDWDAFRQHRRKYERLTHLRHQG